VNISSKAMKIQFTTCPARLSDVLRILTSAVAVCFKVLALRVEAVVLACLQILVLTKLLVPLRPDYPDRCHSGLSFAVKIVLLEGVGSVVLAINSYVSGRRSVLVKTTVNGSGKKGIRQSCFSVCILLRSCPSPQLVCYVIIDEVQIQ